MKRIFWLLIFISIISQINAQNDKQKVNPYDVNVATSQKDAQFPGGSDSLMHFIWANITYPESAQKSNVQGEVQISFDVNFDGTLTHFAAISNLGYGIETELIRILKLSPRWIPAEVNGTKFRQQYLLSFPISRYNKK
jgi:protein TonB